MTDQMLQTIMVLGSHGSLFVDRVSGHIVRQTHYVERRVGNSWWQEETDGPSEEYRDIIWFDPRRWDAAALKYGQTDILTTAFVDEQGRYTRECSVITEGEGDDEFTYLDEVPLLPAPDVEVCLHGFVTRYQNGEAIDEYSDDPEEITGWCIYLRRNGCKGAHPSLAEGDFEIEVEWDFTSREEAEAQAAKLARDYGTTVFAY